MGKRSEWIRLPGAPRASATRAMRSGDAGDGATVERADRDTYTADDKGIGPLVDWLLRQRLLRGPFPFVDYWGSVMGLTDAVPQRQLDEGLVDRHLFRAGLDRPELEVPRLRYYFLLYLIGPLLLPFRRLRRLGRYPIRFREAVGEKILEELDPYCLRMSRSSPGRVDVSKDGRRLASDLLDPHLVAGFSSLFFATYKLPLASLISILSMAILVPILSAGGSFEIVLRYWIPVGFPLLALILWLVYRDLVTAVLGALPLVFGRYLLDLVGPGEMQSWGPFLWSLGGLFAVYLLADWFFAPRPVPPSLLLYTKDGPLHPYDREGDAPYWLEGEAYWVWRYLMLAPAELNKFWERDWERIEIWIRADGPRAGALEWVVTDAHYRELWIPFERLTSLGHPERHQEDALRHAAEGEPGVWLVEVDANVVFHTPWIRTVSFLPEGPEVPVRSLWHLIRATLLRQRRDDPDDYLPTLDTLRVLRGTDVLSDLPEAIVSLAGRHMLATPWRYWRYPLGVQRRREPRLYEKPGEPSRPLAADPELQIKEPSRDVS